MQSGSPTAAELPQHIAIIMDGNGRWARKRAMPRHAGHRAGVKSVRAAVERAGQLGVRHLTLFAFSSENWRRPADEVTRIMQLFLEALDREVDELNQNDVRLEFIGNRDSLSEALRSRIAAAERLTRDNQGLKLTVAVAYGGRWDIVEAARRIGAQIRDGELDAADVSEEVLAQELQLGDVPDPDLLIRTGGEHRISNFLLWHLAYSELYFCDVLWPDFRESDLDAAIEYFAHRQRRYGRTGEQLEAVEC